MILLLSKGDAAGFNPTLLHFAARYNLIKLALAILKCPGGYNALNIKNLDDLNPSGIASECGHEHLAFVLVTILIKFFHYIFV